MKYLLVLLGIGALVVGARVVVQQRQAPSPKPQATTSAVVRTASVSEDPYQLIVIDDAVTVQHPGQDKPQAITDTATVTQGDRIVTSSTGRARLAWPNGTITTLEANTDITLTDLANQGNHSRITLNLGDIWSKVSRILGSDEYYEVQTKETVAAVRGTIFRAFYRDRKTRIEGIDHTVRVFVRNTDGTTDETTGTDVGEQSAIDVDATIVAKPAGQRRLVARKMTPAELRDAIYDRIRAERDLDTALIRTRRTTPTPSPTATTAATRSPIPMRTLTPTVTVVPRATATIPTIPLTTGVPPISSILPLISDLPSSTVKLQSVTPKTTKPGATFALNGSNFTVGRNTRQVTGVLVGYQPAEFSIIDSLTIFITAPQLAPGTYEITVTTSDGSLVNLTPGITIQ